MFRSLLLISAVLAVVLARNSHLGQLAKGDELLYTEDLNLPLEFLSFKKHDVYFEGVSAIILPSTLTIRNNT